MKLVMIEESDRGKFIEKVNEFIRDIDIFTIKFQRNLYYSLSGSMGDPERAFKETSTLKESYLAFVVYR
jgi:hypothetical protein